jgi:uncharacterized paraquat-inducible protein A
MTMPTPPSKPDSPPVTPKVCDCGYDLTGLPSDASAMCPECGLVIADLKPRPTRWFALVLLAVLVPLPVIVWTVGINTSILATLFSDPLSAGFMLMIATAASAVFISVPAGIAFTILLDGHRSVAKQLRIAGIIYVVAVLGAGVLAVAVLTI